MQPHVYGSRCTYVYPVLSNSALRRVVDFIVSPSSNGEHFDVSFSVDAVDKATIAVHSYAPTAFQLARQWLSFVGIRFQRPKCRLEGSLRNVRNVVLKDFTTNQDFR